MELIAISTCLVVFVTVGSLFIGLCQYINSMVVEMKTTLVNDSDIKFDKAKLWSAYVKQICFHNEIIEYDSRTYCLFLYFVLV